MWENITIIEVNWKWYELVLHVAMQISLSVCDDGWFNQCTLIAQCTTGVQPHPFPEFNQTDSGQGRLIKLAIIPTHTTGAFTCLLKGRSLLAGKLAGKSDRWSLSKICVLCWSNLEKWTIDGRSMGLLLCKCFAETELMLGLWRCILLYKKTVEHSPINLCMLLWIKSSEKQW